MADNLKTALKSVIFNCVNEIYFIVDFLPILKRLSTSPHSSQNFGLSVTKAGYGFIHSTGSDVGFCCDKLMRIINRILPNCEFDLSASS